MKRPHTRYEDYNIRCDEWFGLVGLEVMVCRPGRETLWGMLDSATYDSSIAWVTTTEYGRVLIDKSLSDEVRLDERDHMLLLISGLLPVWTRV
ncbi:hypothetical protein ACHMXB_21215 (plasmid) [Arthrobacter sp. UC242_113]|uniref:hypothetical protein n=1 Tax=Arthrobacter sp. UC242_113 TaxID=3374550 RepID=UPI0037574AE9